MRTVSLSFVLLLGLFSVSTASDQPKATSPNDSLSADNQLWDSWSGVIRTESLQSGSDFQADPNHRYVSREPQTVTCLKMRTYLMARESPDSDKTEWVGYTTCQPSGKYSEKFVEGPLVISPQSRVPR